MTGTLDVVGTLNPVQQADVPFAVSGTVGSVAVKVGQRVTAGQELGSLSKASLKAELTAAQSTLAGADLQVGNDVASQDKAATGPGSGSGSTPEHGSPAGPGVVVAAAAAAAGPAGSAQSRPGAGPGQARAGPGPPGVRRSARARTGWDAIAQR